MIDLLTTVQAVLQDSEFTTRLAESGKSTVVCFEDESILGFVCAFNTCGELLQQWRETEAGLLRRFASSLRNAGDKAWNVYTVLLTSGSATDAEARQVRWIEEDLQQTRKLSATGVVSRDDVLQALLPVLPLQFQPKLDDSRFTERFTQRIHNIAPAAANVFLDDAVPATDVARILGAGP